ncbi:MAG: excisionase family DNA-binding protein [Planctomycetales bacterium]
MSLSHEFVEPTEEESRLAEQSGRELAPFLNRNLKINVSGKKEPIELPAPAVRLLVDLLAAMAEGSGVTLIPSHAELSTQQAADLLGVSRPYLIKRLEDGDLPFRLVGTHRRILFQDLTRYKDEVDRKRMESLDALAKQSQELDMGY